jgi:hypothetical protein
MHRPTPSPRNHSPTTGGHPVGALFLLVFALLDASCSKDRTSTPGTGGTPMDDSGGTGGAGGTAGSGGAGQTGRDASAPDAMGGPPVDAANFGGADAVVWGDASAPGGTGGLELAVAPGGDDNGPGTLAHPFATLERARDAVRQAVASGLSAPGATVWIRGGVYERGATLVLGPADSGKPGAPVDWRGYPGETARLAGGRRLDRTWLQPVTSASPVWPRLAPAAQGKVVQVNLPAHGISDYGTIVARGYGVSGHAALELFIDGVAQTLARWPDASSLDVKAGFASLAAPVGNTFGYTGEEPARWSRPDEVWLHGLWGWDWADQHLPVAAIDLVGHTITLGKAPQYPLKAGQPFYAENILEELTVPGEFYLDRTSGVLYFWPPDGASDDIIVSMLDGALVRLGAGAAFITWRDLTFEATRATLVEVQGGQDLLFSGLTLRNAGTTAMSAEGSQIVVHGCEVYGAGDEGVSISGGDRKTLTAAGNVVEMTHIHHWARWGWMYHGAIRLSGVGNIARHNLLHDAPHAAMFYGGNEHLIELNEIHHVCNSTSDAGAIYSGRDWSARGNVLRHNFIHDIKSWRAANVNGIYLDDTLAGIHVEGNVLYNITGAALKHGGGRDDILVNNVIARCGTALGTDARGSGRDPVYDLLSKLEAVGYQMEPWKSRYPECAAIPDSWATVSAPGALWLYPQGTVFSRNFGFANKNWIAERQMATSYFAEIKDDVMDQDPLFVDEAKLDLTLRPDSPALKIPGFLPIPFSSIGLK